LLGVEGNAGGMDATGVFACATIVAPRQRTNQKKVTRK
jgi:hypothetical protein